MAISRIHFVAIGFCFTLTATLPQVQAESTVDSELGPSYGLDNTSRAVAPRGKVQCPKLEMVRYKGDIIPYHKPVFIYVGFRERLRKFEQIVKETAIEVYGRAPRRITHFGTYNCRRIRTWPTFVSEHGMGNAIDVEGFDFPRVRGKRAKSIPRPLRRGFQVRLLQHWDAKQRGTSTTAIAHRKFLHLLAQRVSERRDIFRVMLGPAEPGHQNHFHFDVSPWRIVNM